MAVDFSIVSDACMHTFGSSGTYTGVNVDPVDCVIDLRCPDTKDIFGNSNIISSGIEIRVRISEVTHPTKGGVFALNGVSYRVTGEPMRDRHNTIWVVPATVVS